MKDKIIVTDMYWHNIYLNITMQGENLDCYEYFISNLTDEIYPLEVVKGVCVINIVNPAGNEIVEKRQMVSSREKRGRIQYDKYISGMRLQARAA